MATVAKPRPSQQPSKKKSLSFDRATPEEIATSSDDEFLHQEARRTTAVLSALAERIRQIDEALLRTPDFSKRQSLKGERENLVYLSNEARAYGHELGQRLHKLQKLAQGQS
jgi:hypothetical protein